MVRNIYVSREGREIITQIEQYAVVRKIPFSRAVLELASKGLKK